MRVAAEIAIDQAGFTLVDVPVRIKLPSDSRILGSLVGDLQSIDVDRVRTFYYLRPGSDRAVPKWIGNLARASHAADAGHVYVVVNQFSQELVDSCTEVGAGLLRLTEDGVFEILVDYTMTSPRTLEESLDARITALRREMEHRVELVRIDIEARYAQSAAIIAGMEGDAAESYVNKFDSEYRTIDDWGLEMSRRLDGLGSRSSTTEVGEVESLIKTGPPSAVVANT